MIQNMAKKTFGVYLDEDNVSTAAAGVIKRDYKGNLSAFMDALLKQAVENSPPVIEGKGDVLLEVTRVFHPTLGDEVKNLLPPQANQGRILARFLEALVEAMKRPDFDPTATFHLFNSIEQMTAQVTKTAPGLTLMKSVAQYIHEHAPELMAAEHEGVYGREGETATRAANEAAKKLAEAERGSRKNPKR